MDGNGGRDSSAVILSILFILSERRALTVENRFHTE